tara:strand:+ start:342 stop:542 length:201 start_codon:yes stop_codon:yes gene_type:complete
VGAVPRFAPWGAAAGIGGAWFIFPALSSDFKRNPFGVFGELPEVDEEETAKPKVSSPFFGINNQLN